MNELALTKKQADAINYFFKKTDMEIIISSLDSMFHQSLSAPDMDGDLASSRLADINQLKLLLEEIEPIDIKKTRLEEELESIS